MFSRFRSILGLVPVLALAACATTRPKSHTASKPAQQQAPAATLIGTIESVNDDYHFVLIASSTYMVPRAGTSLKAMTPDGFETGALTVSPERTGQPFIIANIVSGAPQKGDQVFQ